MNKQTQIHIHTHTHTHTHTHVNICWILILFFTHSAFSPSAGNGQEPSRMGLASGSSWRGLS